MSAANGAPVRPDKDDRGVAAPGGKFEWVVDVATGRIRRRPMVVPVARPGDGDDRETIRADRA